jgi:F420-non-reducing hydrogenase small subunit
LIKASGILKPGAKRVSKKKKIAVYTAAGCRACELAILDIHAQVASLSRWAEVVFWPYLLGSEWEVLDEQPAIEVCFFAGAIRTAEDRQAALRLREKSRLMIALGACAAIGGLPGLANLVSYRTPEDSQGKAVPPDGSKADDFPESRLPELEERVLALGQVVEPDYLVPGCPPRQNFLWAAIQSLVAGTESPVRLSFSALRLPQAMAQAITSAVLPPRGSVFSGVLAVCSSCSRTKEEKKFKRFFRPWQKELEAGRCLLEQGFVCQGIVTREGCGGACPAAGLPCRGCFGKTDEVFDPGPKLISAVSSNLDTDDPGEMGEAFEPLIDLAGTVYRYSLPGEYTLLPTR